VRKDEALVIYSVKKYAFFVFRLSLSIHGKKRFYYGNKLGTTNKIFVAATKNFAAATQRFVDRTKHFVVVTISFCYSYFNKGFC